MSEHSSDEEVSYESRGEFAGSIEELHALKLSATQKQLLDDCVAEPELKELLQDLTTRDEGARTIMMGILAGDLRTRLKEIMVLSRVRARNTERVNRLSSRLKVGMRLSDHNSRTFDQLTFRSARKKRS